jgi:signal transduction histidine kinase
MQVPEKIPCEFTGHGKKVCWLHTLANGDARQEIQDDILVCRDCVYFKDVINRGFGRRTADQTLGKTIARLLLLVSEKTQHLENASKQLKSKAEELTLIKIVTDAVVKTTDLNKALKIILTAVTSGRAFGFNRAAIFLIDDRQELLIGKYAVGPRDKDEASKIWNELKNLSFEKQIENILKDPVMDIDSLYDTVSQIKIPLSDEGNILVNSLWKGQPEFYDRDSIDEEMLKKIGVYFDFKEFVTIPLRAEGPPLGLMVADNYYTGQPITEASIDALQTLATACTAVLERTLLHQQLSDRLMELEHLNTLLRENQNYLIQTERLADIGKLAATVAHEFKTPLVTIGGYARRLRRMINIGTIEKKDLDIIASEVLRLEKVTSELLEYSRKSHLDKRPHNINELLRNSLNFMKSQINSCNVRLSTEFDKDEPQVELDERRFRQVVFNIIGNALEAMEPGGKLKISTKAENGFVKLEIEDNGKGIAEDDKDHLFTPFFTTKSGGSGLGLPISKKIVEDHGGKISFESKLAYGTQFSIIVPHDVKKKEGVK